ncbi:MAG: ribosome-associated translation inhibitor RaiA [Sphingomonadales bacterium]
MEIRVSGHQVATGDALRTHVETRLQGVADKYFARAISSKVTFGKGPHDNGFVCDIMSHVMQGLVLKASGSGMEAHPAFEQAADKIERQLRRYMRRLNDHVGPAAPPQPDPAEDARYTVFEADEGAEEVSDHPVVVAETRVDVPDASVSDAVMMLDLRNTNALLFKNAGTGAFNMVYRRGDGTIGWVEPLAA